MTTNKQSKKENETIITALFYSIPLFAAMTQHPLGIIISMLWGAVGWYSLVHSHNQRKKD